MSSPWSSCGTWSNKIPLSSFVVWCAICDPRRSARRCPGLRRRHFAPHAHTVRGATHYIVGLGSNATHVRDPDGLSKALADGVRDGLVDGDVGLSLPE